MKSYGAPSWRRTRADVLFEWILLKQQKPEIENQKIPERIMIVTINDENKYNRSLSVIQMRFGARNAKKFRMED